MPDMAPAVLFLLLGLWMQELALIGVSNAHLLGIVSLVSAALSLEGYRRRREGQVSTATTLAALGRAAHARAVPRGRPHVRVVR